MPTKSPTDGIRSRARRSATESARGDRVKSAGFYQAATVQDRISQWQEHGAASAPPPDAISVLSAPESEASVAPAIAPSELLHTDDFVDSQRNSGRKSTATRDHARRVRSSSTPRKRVVSDEHWRSNRAARHSRKPSPQPTKTPDQLSDQEEEHKFPQSEPSKPVRPRSSHNARAEREERRRRRLESRSKKKEVPKQIPDEGHSVTSLHDVLRDHSRTESEPVQTGGSDDVWAGSAHVSPQVSRSPSLVGSDGQVSQSGGGSWKRSRYAEALGQPPPTYSQDAPLKSKKGAFLNKTKERLGLSDPVPAVSNRLPSIEAWLFDQPDPFNDGSDNRQRSVKVKPQPSTPPKRRSVRWKVPEENPVPDSALDPVPDPNQIWDAIGTSSDNVGIFDHGAQTPEAQTDSNQLDSASPATLKRRTKRASRPKRHTVAHISQDELQSFAKDGDSTRDASSTVPPTSRHEEISSSDRPTRLPTIASVEALGNQPPTYADSVVPEPCGLKRKLTTHEDMMSVLSMPTSRRGTRRKRSVKTDKREQDLNAISKVLETMADDESKYSRELKTLVDGVIPVLLQCVLSKTDAVAAAGLFTRSAGANNDLAFTRPIIDMGIALERLKTLHNRIPLHNVDSLFSWCQTAHKAYSEYLKAWRLGFQDIVIDLAPLEEIGTKDDEAMGKSGKNDDATADENTADVAYLMKRPLVQIRKLGKGLNDLKDLMPDHPVGSKIAEDYDELTAAAKTKHQQEKARLEDEAAAYIDATKCRDIKTMAPLPGAVIDKDKRVRARDCFNLTLYHSSGQRMDCRIELILRDNHHTSPDGGDLLICQVEQAGKWLLFAPVDISLVSARKGEQGCDLVVMVRGRAGIGKEWYELLALQAEDPEAAAEWMMMLGSNPLPPKLNRVPSFIDHHDKGRDATIPAVVTVEEHKLERVPSIESVDLPIGEPSILGVVEPEDDKQKIQRTTPATQKTQPKLSLGGGLSKKTIPEHWKSQSPMGPRQPVAPSLQSSDKSTVSGWSAASSTGFAPSSLAPAYFSSVSSEQPSQRESRHLKQGNFATTRASSSPISQNLATPKTDGKNPLVQNEAAQAQEVTKQSNDKVEPPVSLEQVTPTRPTAIRAPSSAPTQELPNITKARSAAPKTSAGSTPLTDSIRDTWATISGLGRKVVSQPSSPTTRSKSHTKSPVREANAVAPEPSLKHKSPVADEEIDDVAATPPPPPRHREIPVLSPKSHHIPVLRPSAAQQKMDRDSARLSSSPLRNEYAPSAPSASASEDDRSQTSSDDDDDSQTSEDFESELFDIAMPLVSPFEKRHSTGGAFPKASSVPTTGTRTLAPSDSASQGPYRKVPSSAERPDVIKKRASAMVCSWSDSGLWAPIRDDFCLIIISPGLIETFPMDESNPRTTDRVRDPLVAFELTPIVPLRRPTGLDISIRSPPTASSQIKTSNNIMFRSHSVTECDQLYQMINWARCNNLTYIELERSRPRPQPAVTFSNQQAPRPRSWFSLGGGIGRRNSYRVGNVPPSSMGESQATSNTVSSAMSALKRLSISSAFSINRSSVKRRPGLTTSASLYSSSNGTGSGSGASTPPISQLGAIPSKDGPNVPSTSAAAVNGGGMVHNMKIKLLVRKGRDWMPLGVSRLSVLPGVNRNNGTPETSRPGSPGSSTPGAAEPSRRTSAPPNSVAAEQRQYRLPSANFTPHRLHGNGREKRIVITANGKPDKVMLDVTLGESCFEKVAHLGIAMQVWTEDDDVRSRGGVVLGQNTMYMLQFYQQQDCAWVFGLVGSYRYGNALGSQES